MPITDDRTHEYYKKLKYDFGMLVLENIIPNKELRHTIVMSKLEDNKQTELDDTILDVILYSANY